ncbi:MAG: methyltransferase domain-containing protein [Gammaproteobacteria bacterium]|nr:methyltransferase domain-containing protein [Gammaproteobacteria bacterium]
MSYEVPAKIRAAFNRAAESYDHYSSLQATVARKLIDQLGDHCDHATFAVDFGCGSGESTQMLLDGIHCQQVVAVDIADRLLEQARHKLACRGVNVCFGNFNHALFPSATIDLMIANMSLQWSVDLHWTLKRLYSQMMPGGHFAFTLPVEGTFNEMDPRYRNHFATYEEIHALLQQESFTLLAAKLENHVIKFDSPLQALQSIKRVGANCLLRRRYRRGLLSQRKLRQMFQQAGEHSDYGLTYAIAFFIVQR